MGTGEIESAPPTVGRAAPDVPLADADGRPVRLSAFWQDAPKALALVFVRHFG